METNCPGGPVERLVGRLRVAATKLGRSDEWEDLRDDLHHAAAEIERLRAVLTRQGIDWRYRATRNSILFRPMFGPHFGWQPMCGRYGCQDVMFERTDYRELEPAADREDRDARLAFLAVRREQIDELWGRP